MKNFQLIAVNIDTVPILHGLQVQPELWDKNTLRTTHEGTPHGAVNDIWIRFNKIPQDVVEVFDDTETLWYEASRLLPVRPLIFDLARRVEAERIGRCLITKLPPGKIITPHVDEGAPATYYDRYHISLQSAPGVVFKAGSEQVHMRAGEAWWFDNTQEHSVINNSGDDRIHLIVDLRISR